ncbi:MAG TPA: DUF4190 domain-containing protein [Candidatus Brevibacterium intestinavium]|nr:DUF4190 domain-containing protein [Candidatus Brevibacterium intestinavium]
MSSQDNWNNPDMYYQQPQSGTTYGAQTYGSNAVAGSNNAYAANAQYAAGPAYVYQPMPPTNTLAVVAMVCSIFGVVSSVFLAGIGGIIMGHIARKQIRQTGERGEGMAIAALWVGYIGTALWVLFWAVIVLFYLGMFALIFAAGARGS